MNEQTKKRVPQAPATTESQKLLAKAIERAEQYDEGTINESEFLNALVSLFGGMADAAAAHEPSDPATPFYGAAEKMPEVAELARALRGIHEPRTI